MDPWREAPLAYVKGGPAPVREAKINGEDGLYVGTQGYVPRLVQVDLPWHRPPASAGAKRLSQKAPTRGSLRTLGADLYAPSGITLRPDDLVDKRNKQLPVGQSANPKKLVSEQSTRPPWPPEVAQPSRAPGGAGYTGGIMSTSLQC
eukprot:TRINITY_DN4795_c0_g1_i1.p1 TRINITY_DN4795_c0_g1~~TRINITY_DN4795_c0_g1_i1.p1  ORF type:complete len:147 (-),score=12.63 TRINITY_DN4795_c0_g1_i1:303-743(-)